MIDTIVLMLNSSMYQITAPELFTPSAHWVLAENRKSHTIQSKQNPAKRELKQGIYKPRLTVSNRITASGTRDITLKIELSLPKLLFGNNFDELRLKDFAAVVDKLVAVLANMGVRITAEQLSKAYHYIQKIKAANIKLNLDVNQTDYRNEGHSYRWHCNSYEVVFYDKIKDLEKAQISSKRALEKDNEMQLHIFKDLRKRRNKLEILRMEVRLNKRTKIKQLFKMLGIKAELTFKKLFKPAISRKVLMHYLDEIESKRPQLLDYKVTSSKALLADLIMNNPDMSPKQIMQLYGLKQALADVTLRELRVMFARHNKRSWYRLIAEAQKVKLPHTPSPLRNLREQLIK